jgi:hypothetical protein
LKDVTCKPKVITEITFILEKYVYFKLGFTTFKILILKINIRTDLEFNCSYSALNDEVKDIISSSIFSN